jgi:hypothetical protein
MKTRIRIEILRTTTLGTSYKVVLYVKNHVIPFVNDNSGVGFSLDNATEIAFELKENLVK